MWEGEKTTSLPRTRKDFTVTSSNGQIFFVKPGKAFLLTDGNFVKSRFVSKLNGKIARSVVSPCGSSSLHLPKSSPYLSFHKNRVSAKEKNGQKNESSIVVTIPLPGNSGLAVSDSSTNAYLPTGDSVLITEPIQKLSGKSTPSLSDHVQGIAISEDCNVIAISIDQEFWIWQQYPEETKGIGYWTDLTSNHQFSTNAHITSPVNSKHITHGYMKPSQPFTLHPSIGPAIPQGCAITYQDVCLFSNADEGCGVCCLTAYLPPCMPFNELNIFVSVCKFKGQTPTYERSSVQLPIVEGEGNPCAWWSIDCKFLVIAVSQSLVILTRYLRVVKVIPLTKIFPGDSPTVASVAWSSNGEFFIITSIQGNISAVARCGKSLKHSLCSLSPFTNKDVPLMASADSKDPFRFVIYTKGKMRILKIENDSIPLNLQTMISLQFPHQSVSKLFDATVKSILENGVSDPYKLCELLYLTDFFHIFQYYSPLRYVLIQMFEEGSKLAYENQQYIFSYFIIRCIYRLTNHDVEIYDEIIERLSWSTNSRDKYLMKILIDELNHLDYTVTNKLLMKNIKHYSLNDEDKEELKTYKLPHHCRDVNLDTLLPSLKSFLYKSNSDKLLELDLDMNLLLKLMINLGQFQKALELIQHPSITKEIVEIYDDITKVYNNDIVALYNSLIHCISISPNDEILLRYKCIKCINKIIKSKIREFKPNNKYQSISNIINLEETIELLAPETIDEVNDIATIFGIGFCTIDYINCSKFFNNKINEIPQQLSNEVIKLFSYLWFIRWRYLTIKETNKLKRPNNTTLRLLVFPEFIDINLAKKQINEISMNNFMNDVYILYMKSDNPSFIDDPFFNDFCVECSKKILPRTLSRINSFVMKLFDDENIIPKSNLLFAAIVSHLIPWLRCGIPRALVGYDCGEFVPKELLDFEEFIIPEKQIPKMEIQNNEIFNEEEEIKEQTNSGISNNEIIEEEEEEEIKEKVPKKKIKKTKETKKKYVKPKEKVKNKTKIRIKPKSEVKPNLRLLTVDPPKVAPQTFNFTPHIPQPQAYVQLPIQIPMFYPQEQTQTNNKSLWDITPDDFPVRDNLNENNNDEKVEEKEKEIEVVEEKLPESIKKKNVPDKKVKKEIKPEKPILQVQKLASFSEDDKPVKEEKEKSVKNRVPVVIVSRKTEKPKIDEMSLSFSSELSELSLQEPRKRVRPPVNPFPLDDMLYKRVGHLLDEVKASPEAPDLPDVPKFVPPPVYDIPNVDKYRHKDSSDSYAPSSFQSRSSHQSINTKIKRDNTETHRPFEQKVGNEIPQPDWKPNVVPLRNPIILGTNEIKRKNDKPQNAYLQLKEIEPTKKK